MPTNAEAIASVLKRSGIEYAFGLPGGEVVALMDACRVAGIPFYLTGHEASAAFMAEVTGQLAGRPGVCISTLGPGAMNLVLGLANARLDRGPVLAITAQTSTAIERHFPHQRLPLAGIFGQICKATATVDGRATCELVDRCLRTAVEPPPGPVHLALPSDLAAQDASPGPVPDGQIRGDAASDPSAGAALDEIADALRRARRPLVMVGLGCQAADVPALRRFIDAAELPFVVTPKAKGCLPESAPGFLGVVSGMALDAAMLETLECADLLLGVGFDPVECDKTWYVERTVANLSRYSTAEGDYRPIESLSEIGPQLAALAGRAERRPWPAALLAERRAAAAPEPMEGSDGVSPIAAIRALRDVLPPETVMACDVGSHKYFVGQFWRTARPQSFFMSNGLSGMGYGLPAAIAAKLHSPDRPAAAIVGDGGMLMMAHNLVFLRQYGVPVIVVVFVDGSLSLIRLSQERRDILPYGVDFPPPDFAAIAEASGVRGVRAASIDALQRAAEDALRANRPAVIHVPVDMREYRAYC